jgi:hypothetical protein
MYLDKYKDSQLATMALNREKLAAIDYQLKATQAKSKGQLARDKLEMGRIEIASKDAEIANKMREAMSKQSIGSIPGYDGMITDEVTARDFKKQLAARDSALPEIQNLLDINKKSKLAKTFDPALSKSASDSQTLLQGQLREILVGPGTVQESERELMKNVIADTTKFMSLASSNEASLSRLKKAIQNKIDANAKYYGLRKQMPAGAKRIE